MNKLNAEYISQQDIAKRYLQGKLTPEETVEFEEYILDKPELLEQLELDSVLVEAFPKIQIPMVDERTKPANKRFVSLTNILTSPSVAWFSCIAMTVLLFISVSQNNSRFYNQDVESPNITYLEIVRGNRGITTMQVTEANKAQIYALEIGAKDNVLYDIKIDNADTPKTMNSFTKSPNDDGLLILELKNGLASGKYKIYVKEASAEKYTEFFHLQID